MNFAIRGLVRYLLAALAISSFFEKVMACKGIVLMANNGNDVYGDLISLQKPSNLFVHMDRTSF
jgi:hypothetical protein